MLKAVAGLMSCAAAAMLGCAAAGPRHPSTPSKPVTVFPTPAALAAVEAKPVEMPALAPSEPVPEEGWTVDAAGAAGAPADPWAPQGAWDGAFAEVYAASGRKAALTRAMACMAAELGRFHLRHQAAPPEALLRFVGAVCGVFAPSAGYHWLSGEAPSSVSDERVVARWRAQLGPDLLDHVPAAARRVGFWAGRQGGRTVALVAYDATPVEVKPFSVVPDARGEVVIEGRLDGDAASFGGFANQGRFGVKACKADPVVPRPQFRVACPVAAGDDTAWLEIVYVPPHNVLALPLVQVLARRDLERPLTFTEQPFAASHPVSDPAAFGPAVVAGLNAVRAEAGLAPVRLADAESATAARVARHYFAGWLKQGAPGATADMSTIALGLLAGWQVGGTIRGGSFFSVVVPHTHDAGRWLDLALALPLGRETLLGRDIEEVAFGPALFSDPEGIGSVVCGYRFQHGDDHSADASALLGRIVRARQDLRLPAPERLRGVDAVIGRELAYVQHGEQSPADALRESLRAASRRSNANMRGYVFEATSLDALQIPEEILKQSHLYLELGVTHYKPPGAAWAQLVVVVVYIDTLAIQA